MSINYSIIARLGALSKRPVFRGGKIQAEWCKLNGDALRELVCHVKRQFKRNGEGARDEVMKRLKTAAKCSLQGKKRTSPDDQAGGDDDEEASRVSQLFLKKIITCFLIQ